ncbi:uncharacterized protein K452DRAFT_275029 [Aplosporella prunicola CBS 121167]|uniref:CorA-like transporter domain-containing protein n=1 Tax=Aplosporella prunicola CBS 121167 TaxID=1176127 RepID=A0A6A6BAS8_9PEZI|nr:uncharacterized protein K452DRAFT_275029 [Aplosporella prunicola CBS 121167]KAF2139611.1 hypothetical protein K452DRAFT_275029 [Aplosporella prunicola CBS 121167]
MEKPWVQDSCSGYRLDQAKLEQYLKQKFGNYKFFVEVRTHLNITREMLSLLFTYHQVMPGFLDFILTFGKRHHAQTFPFSGFRYHKRLSQTVKGTDIDVLCRSGQDLRLCYNLRSVEPSKRQQNWPWSIRQSAVYHFFDTTTARANWIVVKADKLMKERIISAAQPFGTSGISSFDTNSRAFAATLETHLLFLDWSGENWRWYIDSLENEAQKSTRRTLTIEVEKAPPPMSANPISSISRATTFATLSEQPSIIGGKTDMDEGRPRTPPGLRRACTDPSSFRIQHQGGTDAASYDCQPASPARSNADFSFSDLQRIHFLEEKANETVLVIESNLNVFYELVQFYQSIVDSEEFPGELRLCCKDDMERFISKAKNIENDLRMQQSRAKSLLRMLADRKSLLYGIIEYRSMEASRSLAEKTQLSADNMEIMTRDMHDIAQKTKQETVSMRIITLVTLFYLPGTFISTIMSTDIVRFGSENPASPKKKVSVEAIKLYMAVTLPLMVMTFGAWYGVYLWVNKREKRHNKDLEKGFGCFPENWEPAHISNPVAAKRFFHGMLRCKSPRKQF